MIAPQFIGDGTRGRPRLSIASRPSREPGEDDGVATDVLPGKSVADLLTETLPPPSWVVPSFPLPAESSGLVVSDTNVGKTLLLIHIAAAAVRAGKRVYVVEEEGSRRGFQKRLQRACAAVGLAKVDPACFRYEFQSCLYLLDQRQMRAFEKKVRGFDLILFDCLGALTRGMDENSEEMAVAVESIKQVQIQSGGSTLTAHHINKEAARGKKPGVANVRGHTSLAGRMDTVIELVPREQQDGQVQFEMHVTKQRDEERGLPQLVTICMTGPAATLEMEPLGAAAPRNSAGPSLDDLVFAALPDAGPGKAADPLAKEIHKRNQEVGFALQRLMLKGLATKGSAYGWVRSSGSSVSSGNGREGSSGLPGVYIPGAGKTSGGADAS